MGLGVLHELVGVHPRLLDEGEVGIDDVILWDFNRPRKRERHVPRALLERAVDCGVFLVDALLEPGNCPATTPDRRSPDRDRKASRLNDIARDCSKIKVTSSSVWGKSLNVTGAPGGRSLGVSPYWPLGRSS
jgi:hypothetical protein